MGLVNVRVELVQDELDCAFGEFRVAREARTQCFDKREFGDCEVLVLRLYVLME